MVLERSFDSADLKRLLMDSEMVVDRTLLSGERPSDPTKITRPPLPKGSQVFEAVLGEFQPDRMGPNIRVTGPAEAGRSHHGHRQHMDHSHLSPFVGRSRSNSRSDPGRSRPGSPTPHGRSRPGSPRLQAGAAGGKKLSPS